LNLRFPVSTTPAATRVSDTTFLLLLQLLLVSEEEVKQLKVRYPGLIIRPAENEDKAQWILSPMLFDDQKGPTRVMQVTGEEVRERMKRKYSRR
jgi:hypothetical protein